ACGVKRFAWPCVPGKPFTRRAHPPPRPPTSDGKPMAYPVCSDEIRRYFAALEAGADVCYRVASDARRKGFDPSLEVEIPKTQDLASRVEQLLKDWDVGGIARRIRELSATHDREETAILVAKEVVRRPSKTKEEAIDRAVRVGLAILTEGILVAPLEGLAEVRIKRNPDGSNYVDLSYAGPIRSAGGTGQALSVLIADVVRRELGVGRYAPTRQEVERLKEEIPLYKQVENLLAGRPVLCHPSRAGGLRLRYGKSRANGLASLALHPATMVVLDEFIAVGTQIKTERPGKAGAVSPCESIEGPLVLLESGDFVAVASEAEARELRPKIKRIIDLGEVLVPYGEFLENNHPLVPGAFAIEWYREELRAAAGELPADWEAPSWERDVELSREHRVPLHPKYNLVWHDHDVETLLR